MTIRRGEAWGTTGPAPQDMVIVDSDAAVRDVVEAARREGTAVPPLGLVGGDLMRVVGGTGRPERFAAEVAILPVDVVRIEVDDPAAPDGRRVGWFVAHAVARRRWWRGEIVAAMNAQHLGNWDVAPRGHPNDGRVDLVRIEPTLRLRGRLQARSRLPQGTHVPHPAISIRPVSDETVTLRQPLDLELDGRPWGSATSFRLVVEPDALVVCV